MEAIAGAGMTLLGFFIVGFILIGFGKLTGNRDTVQEGMKSVGQGCLIIIGIIVFIAIMISSME